MEIIKERYKTIVVGKCNTKEDILKLFNFGFSKESVVKKYKRDNKLKDFDARKIVEKVLLENRF